MTFDPHDVIEFFEERAAVTEFEARIPRINAESMALREVADRYGKPAAKFVQQHRENRK